MKKLLFVIAALGLSTGFAKAQKDRKPSSPAIGATVSCSSSGKPSIQFNIKYGVSVTDGYFEEEASLEVNGKKQVSNFDTDAFVSATTTSDNGNKIEHYGTPSYPTKFVGYNNGRLYKISVDSKREGKISGSLLAIDYIKSESPQKIKLNCVVSQGL